MPQKGAGISKRRRSTMEKSYLKGHEIELINNVWHYSDTKTPTVIDGKYQERPCGHCGKPNTEEGHDGCLGLLPGVINACCGHGTDEGYIMFENGVTIRGRFKIE